MRLVRIAICALVVFVPLTVRLTSRQGMDELTWMAGCRHVGATLQVAHDQRCPTGTNRCG